MRSWSSHSGLYSFFPLVATFSFWYNIMIKVHQHALINLVYSYMVAKVFNIQPSRLCWCSECSSTHEALVLKVHLFTWSVKSDSCYNVLWLCSAQTMHLHKSIFFTGVGGVVRLTAKPQYLLLLHGGKEKSKTITALSHTHTNSHTHKLTQTNG